MMHLVFSGELWYWKGPAPHYFVPIPEEQSRAIHAIAPLVTYGWGVIPVRARVGGTAWTTSLIPKDGRYLVPIRANVRKAEQLEEGAAVTVQLDLGSDRSHQ
jgi:hypothetical protein